MCAHQVGAVLNRPTANLIQFKSDGDPRRCIAFGGDGRLRGSGVGGNGLDIDSNGLMWLGQQAKLDKAGQGGMGTKMGSSGLRRVPAMEAAASIKAGEMQLDDYLLVSGLVCFTNEELSQMLATDELHIVNEPAPLWPQVFELCLATNVEAEVYGGTGALLSDGTGVWWAAAQLEKKEAAAAAEGGGIDALLAGLQAMPPSNIADEALNEWLKFFAGHSGGAGDS